jgi:hypothetical protein
MKRSALCIDGPGAAGAEPCLKRRFLGDAARRQVVRQAVQLQRQGVPRQRLVVLATGGASDDALVRYDPDFVDLLLRDQRQLRHYECLDASQIAAVCRRLGCSKRALKRRYEALGLLKSRQARLVGQLMATLGGLWFCILDIAGLS